MPDHRIHEHPILPAPPAAGVSFSWRGQPFLAREGETIASALFANGVRTFGHHPKDGAPQGIFCANGQCAQCTVVADGLPVKSCMVVVRPGMEVQPLDGLPVAARRRRASPQTRPIETVDVECLIIGGGPAGLTAAIELGKAGVRALIVDDKHRLGGKLVLQTHKFFGSIEACHAGTRGIDIATKLEKEVQQFENIRVWLNSTVLVGLLRPPGRRPARQPQYFIVRPDILLVTAGAREKSLVFPGNTLPGVYGAGAFQTLVNRDLVRPDREAVRHRRRQRRPDRRLPRAAGRHRRRRAVRGAARVRRLQGPQGQAGAHGRAVYTSHTILRAEGRDEVEAVVIAEIDKKWRPIPGTEKRFECDTVLVAVGLDPVDEFLHKANEFGLPAVAAGDSEEIAEASAAMFTGRIRGLEIAKRLGRDVGEVPPEWHRTAEVLKSRPGPDAHRGPARGRRPGVFPIFHCAQEIPCNPCTSICPQPRHPDRGRRRDGAADVRGRPVRRLREVRGHLPGPGHHARGLPQGRRRSRRWSSPTSSRRSGSRRATRSPCSTARARCSATSR